MGFKKITFIIFFMGILFLSCHKKNRLAKQEFTNESSSLSWKNLDSYPIHSGRNDDLFFISPDKGWVINNQGHLYVTTNGGESWDLQFQKEGSFFRCIAFADSLNGWIGTLGLNDKNLYSSDSTILYETHDGGKNWQSSKITGPYPTGLCGLQKINENVIVGCGRVRGPSYFIKTTDKGKSWQSYNLEKIAGALIAPYFFDELNGILIGGTSRDKKTSRALILSTQDGGLSWQNIFESSQTGEYCWKVVFPTKQTGYVSIQRNMQEGSFHFLKTVDGGKTWSESVYADQHYFTQGIGFINEKIGWIGGSSSYGTYETQDGGKSWTSVPNLGKGLNKFQFVNDTLGYAVGKGIYKIELSKNPVSKEPKN